MAKGGEPGKRTFDLIGIAIGRAQTQYPMGTMLGGAKFAAIHCHRPNARKEAGLNFLSLVRILQRFGGLCVHKPACRLSFPNSQSKAAIASVPLSGFVNFVIMFSYGMMARLRVAVSMRYRDNAIRRCNWTCRASA